MAIQFFCVACRQPIEVDNGMANQTVTCPYCRKVVTAPAATDETIRDNPPIARPPEGDEISTSPGFADQLPAAKNTLSWVSLGCVTVSLIIMAILAGVGISIARGLDPKTPPQEVGKLVNEELRNRPGIQALSVAGSCVIPLAGIICGIAALIRRTPPRWPAITALIAFGLLILLVCMGFVFAASSAAGKAGG